MPLSRKYNHLHVAATALALALVAPGMAIAAPKPPPPPTEVRLWHVQEGAAAGALADLVVRFNATQQGKGIVRLSQAPQADGTAHGGVLPELALFDADATMAFFGTRPRMRSLDDVMRAAGMPLAATRLLPQLADAVIDGSSRLQALPIALSVPVLMVNRTLYARAALDASAPPATWVDVQSAAGQLAQAGIGCPLTSSHFAWIHVESLSAQAGEPVVRRARALEHLAINGYLSIKHLALLSSWQKSRYFSYLGPGREADAHFLAGECAMITGASALVPEARRRGLDVVVAPLPRHDDVRSDTDNTLTDGESLWVLAGTTRAQDQLIARFVRFLLEPANQRDWVARTGYLPMIPAALSALIDTRTFPDAMQLSVARRLTAPRTPSARVSAGAARERYRAILGEELAPVWSEGRAPKEALDRTVERSEALPGVYLPRNP